MSTGISCFLCPGTDQARGLAQTLLNVPYGDGDGEKLDVYIPSTNSLGMFDCHDTPMSFFKSAETRITCVSFNRSGSLCSQMSTLLFTYMEATGSFSGTGLVLFSALHIAD